MAKKIDWEKILGFLGIIFEGLGGMCDRLSERMAREKGYIRAPTQGESRLTEQLKEELE